MTEGRRRAQVREKETDEDQTGQEAKRLVHSVRRDPPGWYTRCDAIELERPKNVLWIGL